MHDVLGPGTILGYCTNVHAGATLRQSVNNIRQYTAAVKSHLKWQQPLGFGWWLSADAAAQFMQELISDERPTLSWLKPWLNSEGLLPFTLNGFPYGDFHTGTVKHRVFEPSWAERNRYKYTDFLSHVIRCINSQETELSISTLPIGWPRPPAQPIDVRAAAANLLRCASRFARIEAEEGVCIHLDLEPEPGCILQRSDDVVRFFTGHLLPRAAEFHLDEATVLRHLRVCHDICHAAVMFEDQAHMFNRYRAAGIRIGKVQISNAISVDFKSLSPGDRHDAITQLRSFSESRYLHQTMIRRDDVYTFYEDLPNALDAISSAERIGDEWRVHFHVPVDLAGFGLLRTTRDAIVECLGLLHRSEVKHWEVETYAWNVLPPELQVTDLAEGIARELAWVMTEAAKRP